MILVAEKLYAELQSRLASARNRVLSLQEIEECFNLCSHTAKTLLDQVKQNGFVDKWEETQFFKKVKPRFISLLRYYILLYNHHLFHPSEHNECLQYLERNLNLLKRNNDAEVTDKHDISSSHLANQYFTSHDEERINISGNAAINDRIAKELLAEYIGMELECIRQQNDKAI